MPDDKHFFLNQLPGIGPGYNMDFVFGKCLYKIVVEDLLMGMTNENDLIWVSDKESGRRNEQGSVNVDNG